MELVLKTLSGPIYTVFSSTDCTIGQVIDQVINQHEITHPREKCKLIYNKQILAEDVLISTLNLYQRNWFVLLFEKVDLKNRHRVEPVPNTHQNLQQQFLNLLETTTLFSVEDELNIQTLMMLGFDRNTIVEMYLLCNKNYQLTMQWLIFFRR